MTVWSHVIDDPSTAGGPVSLPIASDSRVAKEKTGQIVADLGLDPVDVGPLRFARNIESLTEMILVPTSQGRDEYWNFYFPRANYAVCYGYEGDGSDDEAGDVVDADNLAVMPRTQPPLEPCPQ